jgi:lysine N6-hydroxylase
LVDCDVKGRYRVGLDYRVGLRPDVTAGLCVQNAELHTNGVGTPDLGLGAHRAAVILNAVCTEALGRPVHRLPEPTAWTTFGRPRSALDLPMDAGLGARSMGPAEAPEHAVHSAPESPAALVRP